MGIAYTDPDIGGETMSKGEDRMMLKRATEKPRPERAGTYDPIFHSEDIAAAEARGYDDGYKAGLAEGSSVAEEVMRDCEARGAARAVEQCRRLAEEAADRHDENADRYGGEGSRSDDWPLSKNEEMKAAAMRDFAASLPTGSTASEFLARYRPAPPSVVNALRAAVEAFPCPDEPQDGGER